MFSVTRPIPAVKPLGALLAALALLLGLAGPAAAEAQTVQGSGDLAKMVVNNGTDAVVARLYGPGKKCDRVRWVSIRMSDSAGQEFVATGACTAGVTWTKSLDNSTTSEGVPCDGLRVTYDSTRRFWRIVAPRTCLTGLADTIRVRGELVTTTSAQGLSNSTRRLSRG